MKKLCFLLSALLCLLSLPCYAASEEDVNIFEGGTRLDSIYFSVTPNITTPDIKINNQKSNDLKTLLTNGVFDEGNKDRLYVQNPQKYTTLPFPPAGSDTSVNGVSIVFKFNANQNPGVKRLVFYAGAASTTNDGSIGDTLDPSLITISSPDSNSTYTKLDFTADNFTYYPISYYDNNGNVNKKGTQVLTLNLKEETSAKFIRVTITQSAAFRIREIEAYGTTGDTNSVITGSTLDNPYVENSKTNPYPNQTLTLNLSDDAAAQNYTYIVAKYDQDGKLTYVKCKQKDESTNDESTNDESTNTVTFKEFTRDLNEKVKVFIWNGFDKLIPASDSYNVIPNASVK